VPTAVGAPPAPDDGLWHRLFGGRCPSLADYVAGRALGEGNRRWRVLVLAILSTMPVPKDRTDVAYVKPLADLRDYGDMPLWQRSDEKLRRSRS